jgi:hypothetical protein
MADEPLLPNPDAPAVFRNGRAIDDAYTRYSRRYIPMRAPREQREETRRAFFMGAYEVLNLVVSNANRDYFGKLIKEARENVERELQGLRT